MPRPESKKSETGEAAARGTDPDHLSGDGGHLANIEKLLNATYDLMKQEPTLDRAAFEHLRQLRVKVRYAISAASPDRTSLPNRPPRRWHQRADRSQSALSFLVEWYHPWLEAGTISRADVRRLDKPLYTALYSAKLTDEQLRAIGLPTKKDLNSRKLAAIGNLKRPSQILKVSELPSEERELARLWSVARRRRERASEK